MDALAEIDDDRGCKADDKKGHGQRDGGVLLGRHAASVFVLVKVRPLLGCELLDRLAHGNLLQGVQEAANEEEHDCDCVPHEDAGLFAAGEVLEILVLEVSVLEP